MSTENLTATADISINAPVDKVWQVLIDTESNNQFMFGSSVTTDWKEGSDITWKGKWKGHDYEDKGKILKMLPGKLLQYTHYSQMMDNDDSPENYRTVTIELTEAGPGKADVHLTQNKNKTKQDKADAERNWNIMLASLKNLIEGNDESKEA